MSEEKGATARYLKGSDDPCFRPDFFVLLIDGKILSHHPS